jgi:hypothetical protein
MDTGKAVTAAAHKLARRFYALMTQGQECIDQGQRYCKERYRQRVIHHLQRRSEPRHGSGADRTTPKKHKRISYLEGVS